MDICTRVEPQNVLVEGRMVKCHLYDQALLSTASQRDIASIPLEPVG